MIAVLILSLFGLAAGTVYCVAEPFASDAALYGPGLDWEVEADR